MIITQRTPEVLFKLLKTYEKQNDNGKAFKTVQKAIFHNNEPINILVAVTCLKDVDCLVRMDWTHSVNYEYCLRYFSDVTGYSPVELQNRVDIK